MDIVDIQLIQLLLKYFLYHILNNPILHKVNKFLMDIFHIHFLLYLHLHQLDNLNNKLILHNLYILHCIKYNHFQLH